jgi:N-acetylglutamate synthase (N-acetylornithine aminotransferase)
MIKTDEVTLTNFQWPTGYYNDGIEMGLGVSDKLDFGYLVSEVPASAAGTYTTNKFQAAPTKLTKNTINQDHQLQAVVMNSACANSCTGKQGEQNALTEQKLMSEKLGIDLNLVGVASTGLIGAQLPMDKVTAGIKNKSPSR